MNKEEIEKDILYDIEMQLYMEFNNKIATMNDYLGEIYSYKDIEDVKQAEQIRKIVLMEIAIKDLQQKLKQLETNRDEALEYLKYALDEEKETPSKHNDWRLDLSEILERGKGGSNENSK